MGRSSTPSATSATRTARRAFSCITRRCRTRRKGLKTSCHHGPQPLHSLIPLCDVCNTFAALVTEFTDASYPLGRWVLCTHIGLCTIAPFDSFKHLDKWCIY